MQIPLLEFDIKQNSKEAEMEALNDAIAAAISQYQIEGVVHGGISSDFQKRAFEALCVCFGIAAIAPLWHADRLDYMNELIEKGFQIMIVSVSAMGLGEEWLGRHLDKESISSLAALSKKHGFDLAFEGGEAETLVIDCPLYSKRIEIKNADIRWDGQRGIFEIRDVALVEK
jgi:predicted ATP pyrophosphatase (TIGR00289 family)